MYPLNFWYVSVQWTQCVLLSGPEDTDTDQFSLLSSCHVSPVTGLWCEVKSWLNWLNSSFSNPTLRYAKDFLSSLLSLWNSDENKETKA